MHDMQRVINKCDRRYLILRRRLSNQDIISSAHQSAHLQVWQLLRLVRCCCPRWRLVVYWYLSMSLFCIYLTVFVEAECGLTGELVRGWRFGRWCCVKRWLAVDYWWCFLLSFFGIYSTNVFETEGWSGETLVICKLMLCKDVVSDAVLLLVVRYLYI